MSQPAPRHWTDPFIDPWVPAAVRERAPQYRQARVVVMLALVQAMALAATLPVLATTLPGSAVGSYAVVLGFAIAQLALPAVLRATGRAERVTTASLAMGLAAAWIVTARFGGPRSPMLLWTVQVPVLAQVTVGARHTRRWLALNAVAAVALAALELAGAIHPEALPPRAAGLWAMASVLTLTVAQVLLGVVNDRGRAEADIEHERAMEALKATNRELARARDAARTAERTKGEFLASMSHEIRTPMNAVIGMTGLLLDTPLDDTQRSYAETVRSSADGLLTIINDILDFSKIEAGRMELEVTEFDLQHALSDGLRLFAEPARARRIELVAHLDAGVPARVMGDPGRVRQVVLNLVGNALKFTDRGSVRVEVSLYKGEQLRFAVRDTGIGIAADVLPRLFTPFSQADQSTTRRFGGTGLGLAICKQLVELMGGRIAVHSQPDVGSTFQFTAKLPPAPGTSRIERAIDLRAHVPMTPIHMTRRPLTRPRPAVTPIENRVAAIPTRARVLVVEDNVVNQRVARALLAAIGYDSDMAADGREATEAVTRIAYAVVLMDVQMPIMDGLEATRIIRAREKNKRIPIIALTANAMHGDRERCTAAGMDDFLTKPIQRAALAAMLQRYCPQTTGEHPAAADAWSFRPHAVTTDVEVKRRH